MSKAAKPHKIASIRPRRSGREVSSEVELVVESVLSSPVTSCVVVEDETTGVDEVVVLELSVSVCMAPDVERVPCGFEGRLSCVCVDIGFSVTGVSVCVGDDVSPIEVPDEPTIPVSDESVGLEVRPLEWRDESL